MVFIIIHYYHRVTLLLVNQIILFFAYIITYITKLISISSCSINACWYSWRRLGWCPSRAGAGCPWPRSPRCSGPPRWGPSAGAGVAGGKGSPPTWSEDDNVIRNVSAYRITPTSNTWSRRSWVDLPCQGSHHCCCYNLVHICSWRTPRRWPATVSSLATRSHQTSVYWM